MPQTLSEALHEKLDQLGAPARATQPAEEPVDEPTVSDDENQDELLAEQPNDDSGEEYLVDEAEEGDEIEADEGGEEATEQVADTYKPKELAEAIGWDAATLYTSLTVPLGNGKTVTLGQMKDDYDSVERDKAEIETVRQQLAAQYQELQQQQQQVVQGYQGVSNEIMEAQGQMKAIEAQYEQVDWEKMDSENPGLAANTRQKFATAYSKAEAEMKAAQEKAQQSQVQAINEMRAREAQRVVQLIPEWEDMKTYEAEAPEINKYLMSRGFTEQEIGTIFHAGAWAVARDAWMGSQARQEVEKAKVKVRKAPRKIMRPGGGPARRQIADKRVTQLSDHAKRTGQPQDKLAAARAIVQQAMNTRR